MAVSVSWCSIGVICVLVSHVGSGSLDLHTKGLPEAHLPYYFSMFPEAAQQCANDTTCPYKQYLDRDRCWGYEPHCSMERAYSWPRCVGDHNGWVRTKQAQVETFYAQGDFGYVKDQIESMKVMCEPLFYEDTFLECSKYLRFCRGRNIMMNFTGLLGRGDNLRYKMDILGPGDIGGHCELYKERLDGEIDHISPLQSWAPEMRYFEVTQKRPIQDGLCDIVIEKPTYVMKIDATINMYHHFCDFFNLYASLHVNAVHPMCFSKDNHVLIWETFTYDSSFKETWKAFTDNPIWDLKRFRGKVVCFRNVVFPLLPRMIFGLYYNTPIIYGCENSGLFHAFTTHILNGLNIVKEKRENDKIRVTLLSRGTKYRKILNEDQLLEALDKSDEYIVQKTVYNRSVPFSEQLHITHNTDIFIGMHGAGLTHLLFLPDWAVVFELYNCDDSGCYLDLARLRGVKYITWEDRDKLIQEDEGHHPDGGSHPKFTNYEFDVGEFLHLVKVGANHVREHELFKKFVNQSASIHDEL